VEILEQQQAQLVTGLRELYHRLQAGEEWPGMPLEIKDGRHPLTHDILKRLDLLVSTDDALIEHKDFEEDLALLKRSCVRGDDSQQHPERSPGEDCKPGNTSPDITNEILSPAQSTMCVELLSLSTSSQRPTLDSPRIPAPQNLLSSEAQQYDMLPMSQTAAIDPMELSFQTQYWMDPQQSSLAQIEIDPFSYNTSISYEPQDTVSYPIQISESTSWAELFTDLIQPINLVKM
jgi:hypothetical protein